jgi:hypothetical protein
MNMHTETLISNHKRVTERLGRVIEEMTIATPGIGTPVLFAIIEAKVDVLRSLGLRLKAVAELENKLAACKVELGKEAA